MNAPESKFWVYLRSHLKGHAVRIENVIGRGTPDVHYTLQGNSCWIELKVVEGTKVKPKPEQRVFAYRECAHGGHFLLLARSAEDKKLMHIYQWPFNSSSEPIDIRNNPGKIVSVSDADAVIKEIINHE